MALLCENDPPLFSDESRAQIAIQLYKFKFAFQQVHGYLSAAICVFGIVTNLMHVLILTRPSMRNSVNCLLTAVAICDMGTMSTYLIYLSHFELSQRDPNCYGFSQSWIQFLLVHVFVSIYLHSVSLWLVVTLAFVRRMSLRVQEFNSQWQRARRAWRLCGLIFASVFLFCAPTMLVHKAGRLPPEVTAHCSFNKSPRYTVEISEVAQKNGCRLFKLNLWTSGLLLKVVPSALMVILMLGLLVNLRWRRERRRSTLHKDTKRQQRTTVMLVLILAIFLATELPQGVLAILGAIYTRDVYQYIYAGVGDAMDFLSLANSSVNFILYLFMSSKYRKMFAKIMLPTNIYKRFYSASRCPSACNYYTNHSRGAATGNLVDSQTQMSVSRPPSLCRIAVTPFTKARENRTVEISIYYDTIETYL